PQRQDRGTLEAAAHRRGVRAAPAGAGAPHGTDRDRARRRAVTHGRRRGDRGLPPVHDDARGREAEFQDPDQCRSRPLPVGSADARRIPYAGLRAASTINHYLTTSYTAAAPRPPRGAALRSTKG